MFENLPKRVYLREVGPRDGLQMEPEFLPTKKKQEFIERLAATGLPHIELTSFVNPRWIPALADGPVRVRELSLSLKVPRFAFEMGELVRRRLIVRIALTPTDVFCAEGRVPDFSQEAALHVMSLYARMLDLEQEAFHEGLTETIRRQATATLASFLIDKPPETGVDTDLMERLTDMMLDTAQDNGAASGASGGAAHLALDPRARVVLVGAGAPVLFEKVPQAMNQRLVTHPDGDVANAVGAISSRFILRENVTLEPVRYGGVELFDHQGKTFFPDLQSGLEHARAHLRNLLEAQAREHRLTHTDLRIHEEVIEDYADYSKRGRKELIIAHVEGMLTGMPE